MSEFMKNSLMLKCIVSIDMILLSVQLIVAWPDYT